VQPHIAPVAASSLAWTARAVSMAKLGETTVQSTPEAFSASIVGMHDEV
jgi:hypothetical protein